MPVTSELSLTILVARLRERLARRLLGNAALAGKPYTAREANLLGLTVRPGTAKSSAHAPFFNHVAAITS